MSFFQRELHLYFDEGTVLNTEQSGGCQDKNVLLFTCWKRIFYSQINDNPAYALTCFKGLESEEKKKATGTFCSWNTIKAKTLIKLAWAVLWLSCTCRDENSTLSRMASSLKPILPSPTNLTCYFMPQPVAGIAAPVAFQMLCTELQQIVYVKAPATPRTFFSWFPLVQFH